MSSDPTPPSPSAPPTPGSGLVDFVIAQRASVGWVLVVIGLACAAAGVPLVVVGDGPERGRLQALAGPDVRLAGRVERPELRRLLAGAAFYLQPGIEDFGIATVEALACGTPVLALARGGVLDIVEDGRHGHLIAGHEADGAGVSGAAHLGPPEVRGVRCSHTLHPTRGACQHPASC